MTVPVPLALRGRRSDLVAFYYPPASHAPGSGDVLLAPPFGEEMNRCRAMVAMQARAMAAAGLGVLMLDPQGTGDSGGEHDDADWDGWRDDLQTGIAWLRQHGRGCRTVWGVRLGALMAAELAQADAGIDRLLFWQPVTSGKTFWTQFLRIRIAAEMAQADGVKSTDALRAMSAAGEVIDVSGYPVSPALAMRLDKLALPPGAALAGRQIRWLEVLASAEAVLPRANQLAAQALTEAGVDTRQSTVIGPAFWHVHERDVAPALLAATNEVVQEWVAQRSPLPTPALPAPAESAPAAAPDVVAPEQAAECPLAFPCGGEHLSAVLHRAPREATVGVVIVVAGGPQYRAGAHRQFVALARRLAAEGFPVLRFDLRGMGDSSGEYLGYHHSAPDIRAAIDELQRQQPAVREVMLFGECESASGILFYAYQRLAHPARSALANPWVRTARGPAPKSSSSTTTATACCRASSGPHLVRGQASRPVRESIASFVSRDRVDLSERAARRCAQVPRSTAHDGAGRPAAAWPRRPRACAGFRAARLLILMSGQRLHRARVRRGHPFGSASLGKGCSSSPCVQRVDIAGADHTFSQRWKWKLPSAA